MISTGKIGLNFCAVSMAGNMTLNVTADESIYKNP